ATSSRPGWTSLRTFYDTAPARGSEVITATRTIDVGPDCFHEEKTIISNCNNFDRHFQLLCYLVKEAYFHRNKGDEMLVDTLLMARGPEAYALLPAPMPMQAPPGAAAGYKFSEAEITEFKKICFDPTSGRKIPDCGKYWDTFDLNIRTHLNEPIIIHNRLGQMLDTIINAEMKEGRGPHKGDSVLSQAAIKAIKRAMPRATDFTPYPSGFVEHRELPGKKTLDYLPIWRVNGRGSLGCERVHAVMNTLVSKNMNPVVGSLNLLEGVAMYNAEIRETLEIGYGCPGLYDWHKCCQWARLTCYTHPDIDISLDAGVGPSTVSTLALVPLSNVDGDAPLAHRIRSELSSEASA
ncbi:hypothetical protein CYMTET_29482, partial [Cymbomonas tetramitiformis]